MSDLATGTAKGAVVFLDHLVEKGRSRKGVVTPLKIAFVKVLSTVEGDGWESVDVRQIDLDDYMERFGNLTLGRYTSESLGVYRSRVKRLIEWYSNFLENPGWVPPASNRSAPTKKTEGVADTSGGEAATGARHSDQLEQAVALPAESGQHTAQLIAYPFPLESGQLATLHLPLDITTQDTKRLAAFLNTLTLHQGEKES